MMLERKRRMYRVMIVCLGNICRSPMAEGILKQMLKQNGLERQIAVSSAATSAWEQGNPPHIGTQRILKRENISTKGMVSKQITAQNFQESDLILGMDQQNVADLLSMAPKGTEKKIHLFLENGMETAKEVPDPYYTGNFELTYQLIQQGCKHWLETICTK